MYHNRLLIVKYVWRLALPVGLAAVCLVLVLGGMRNAALAASPFSSTSIDVPATGNVITIGVAADLSGPAENIGWRQANAVQLAADQINAAGGVDIGGTPYSVTVVFADSMCNPTQAITAANTLLAAGAVAVVGHTCSGASNAAQPLYFAAGVSMVSPSSTGPFVTEQGYTTTFRVISRDDTLANVMAAYFQDTLVMERAAIVEFEAFWGNWAGDAFSETFTSLGGIITSRNTLTSTTALTATLAAIQAEDAHVIYLAYHDPAVAGQMSQIAYNLGMTEVPIAWYPMDSPYTLLDGYSSAAGAAAEADFVALSYRDTMFMPDYPAFNAAYVAAGFPNHGGEALMWGAFAYDAMHIIVAAIDRADSLVPLDIRAEIAATADYDGVVGIYEGFDAKGDVIPQWGFIFRYLEGHWLNLNPEPGELDIYEYRWADDFSGTSLDPRWSWLNEDPTHWSLTAHPGYLRIVTQQEVLYINWLLQPAPQTDFAITTRLVFTPTDNFHIAGISLYDSEGTIMMLGRAYCGFGYPGCANGNGIYFDHVEGGMMIGDNFAMATSSQGVAYLRIVRQGNTYTGYYSEDGLNWILVGRHVTSPGVSLPYIGIAAHNNNQPIPDIPADFDFFWLDAYYLIARLPLLFK